MSEDRQLVRRRRIYLFAIFALLALTLAVLGFQSNQSTRRARRTIERSFSDSKGMSSYDLSRFGTQACVNALTDLLAIRPSTGADWYAKAYNKMPQGIKKQLPTPLDRMKVLSSSIDTLGQLGSTAAPAVPGLLRIYQDRRAAVTNLHRPVIRTLGRIGVPASNAIPALLLDLSPGPKQDVVVEAFLRIDRDGTVTYKALRQLRHQPGYEGFVSNLTATCLRALEPSSPGSSAAVGETPKYPSRWTAFLVAGLLRSESKQTVPILRGYLDDENGVLRGLATTSLSLLGPAALEALPDLRRCLTDEWSSVREAATNAVQAIESVLGNSFSERSQSIGRPL